MLARLSLLAVVCIAVQADSQVPYTRTTETAKHPCASLISQTTHDYSIISADSIAATDEAPEHCRVRGAIPPEIMFEVNLPTRWNRRLLMTGNGGYAGTPVDAPNRVAAKNRAVSMGFASAYTDTGHDRTVEPLGTFAYNNRQKEIDYSFRAVHLTIQTAKELAAAYYDQRAAYSYWQGCSTGGRQGLMSAQRFPEDFDGIVSGAPVLNFTDIQIWGAWNAQAMSEAPISLEKIGIVADAVYDRCDRLDGVEDGLLDDPRACDFEPRKHLPICNADASGRCLTDREVSALEKIYGGVMSGGKVLFPGLPLGAEAAPRSGPRQVSGWNGWLINENGPSRQQVYAETFFQYLAFNQDDPNYDWRTFDYDEDPDKMGFIRSILDASNPDLSGFRDADGKMLMYFGWADPALNPMMGVNYYEDVLETIGPETTEFYRLFMVPGMFHCAGGLGVSQADYLGALVDWVEAGKAPERLEAARVIRGKTEMTRPLCPYPQVAKYKGAGDVNDAANFSCVSQ